MIGSARLGIPILLISISVAYFINLVLFKAGKKYLPKFWDYCDSAYVNVKNQHPIFKDLKRLGEVTAIVKWIKDNDVPIDLSFISNYQVPVYPSLINLNGVKTVVLQGGGI